MYTKLDTERGALLSEYVLARVTKLDGINLNKFDFDRHNTLFYFVTNEHGHVYLRYGGRNSEDAEKFLNLDSITIALKKGLELFSDKPDLGAEVSSITQVLPSELPSLKAEVISRNRCVECHLAEDHLSREKIAAGIFEPLWDLYSYPDIEFLGIEFDVPKGIVLSRAEKNAKSAGLLEGDLITHIQGHPVYTYADLQHEYNKLNRYSKHLQLQILRDNKKSIIQVDLPKHWWKSNLRYKHWSMEPILSFSASNLEKKDKEKLGLQENEFAAKIESIDIEATLYGLHDLKEKDIVYNVNGVTTSDLTDELITYIKLLYSGEQDMQFGVIREGEKIEVPFKSSSKRFRKIDVSESYQLPKLSWHQHTGVSDKKDSPLSIRTTTSSGYLFIELLANTNVNTDIALKNTELKIANEVVTNFSGEYRGKTYIAIPLIKVEQDQVNVSLKTQVIMKEITFELNQVLPISTSSLDIQNGGMLFLLSNLSLSE